MFIYASMPAYLITRGRKISFGGCAQITATLNGLVVVASLLVLACQPMGAGFLPLGWKNKRSLFWSNVGPEEVTFMVSTLSGSMPPPTAILPRGHSIRSDPKLPTRAVSEPICVLMVDWLAQITATLNDLVVVASLRVLACQPTGAGPVPSGWKIRRLLF